MLMFLVLQSKGIKEERVVVLHLRRGFHVIEWIIATLKAGGAFVYIEPGLNDSRKHSILATSDPALIITDDSSVGSPPWADGHQEILVSHMAIEDVALVAEPKPLRKSKLQDLAYVIFTSGTTGTSLNLMLV